MQLADIRDVRNAVLGQVRRNFYVGVRTPWTIADEGVWNRTHRLAAWLYTASGCAGCVAVLAGAPLAWVFGILFQYFAIAPLRGQLGRLTPLGDAIKSDTLSVLSFEVGLFGWMALAEYAIWRSPPPIDSSSHWFLMQIGMILGFSTSWPVNRWLLSHGIKEPMATV